MFEVQLFLGFPADALFQRELEKVDSTVLSHYIQESDKYLMRIIQDEVPFLGKKIEKITTVAQLELLEANVFSILKKLVPDYPYEETNLYLFPIYHANGPSDHG